MLVNQPSKYYDAMTYLYGKIDLHSIDNPLRMIVDTETTGLRPWSGDRICGIVIKCEGRKFYFPFRHGIGMGEINIPLERMEDFREILSGDWVVYDGHNYKFDMQMFYVDGIPMPKRIRDSQLAAHLMNENEPDLKDGKPWFRNGKLVTNFKLKSLGDKYISGESSRESEALEKRVIAYGYARSISDAKGNLWKLPPEAVSDYAIQDVDLTEALIDFYIPHLKTWRLYDIWEEVNEYEIIATWMEIYGMPLDLPLMYSYMAESQPKAQEYLLKLQEIAGYPLNPRSNPQIAALLGLKSSKKEILETIRDSEEPLMLNPNYTLGETVRTLEAYRSYEKVNVNYYEKFDRLKDQYGNIHTSIFLTGTISGRWSMGDPPMQAIPKKSVIYRVKDVFRAREGYTLVEADQKQAEMRVANHYTGDQAMRDRILRGADIHTENSEELGIPRDAAKRIGFGCNYGIGKVSLARQLHCTEQVAEVYLNKYHGLYKGFRILSKKCEAMALARGYIRMWTGRIRHYDAYNEEHKAMSNLIQGAVAEIIRVCSLRCYRELAPRGVRQLLQVHDSLVFEVPDGILFEVLPIINNLMTDFDFDVPLGVDIKYGKSWGKMTEWKGETA